MIRLGFGARLLAIVLTSLVAVQILAMFAVFLQRSRATDGGLELPLPDQAKALVELLEELPKEQWSKLLRAANSSEINVRILEKVRPLAEPAWYEAPVADFVLRRYLASLGERDVRVRVEPSSDNTDAAMTLLHWASPGMIEIEIGLKTGQTLVIAAYGYTSLSVIGLPPGLWAGLLGVFIAAAAVILLRREAQPLLRLADQVDQVVIGSVASELDDAPRSAPEIRALIAAFNRYGQRIAALLRGRMVLVSGISHDLRTYVTRLRLRADLIADATERERAIADLDDMSRLLDDSLLAFSGGAQVVLDELVDVAMLLEREVQARHSAGSDITLAISIGASGAHVIGNALALSRVFANLTDNALKYGSSAKVMVDIVGDRLLVTIDDRGPGIDPQSRAVLFEPFVRLEGSRNRATGGAGLGLAIARGIVERHGGSVSLEEAPGGGTRAVVTLPLFSPEN